jgi:hypothetical protein
MHTSSNESASHVASTHAVSRTPFLMLCSLPKGRHRARSQPTHVAWYDDFGGSFASGLLSVIQGVGH